MIQFKAFRIKKERNIKLTNLWALEIRRVEKFKTQKFWKRLILKPLKNLKRHNFESVVFLKR